MTTKTACLNLLEEFWAGKLTARELEAKCKEMQSKQLTLPIKAKGGEANGKTQDNRIMESHYDNN